MNFNNHLQRINELISSHQDESGFSLSARLKAESIPHLSYSQVKSVEFCPIQYHFQYVQHLELDPIPAYFTKGKILHEVIANNYAQIKQDPTINEFEILFDENEVDEQHVTHIHNAIDTHMNNMWEGYEILGIETPFALMIEPDLPPVVGVIDLILRDEKDSVILVDHKTGHYFNEQDQLQMAIYHRYIQQQFAPNNVEFYYDHYRWVNNLARIRKPAFSRERINLSRDHARASQSRITAAAGRIEQVRAKKTIDRRWYADRGECFRCPYKKDCYG